MAHILIVDDEASVRELIKDVLAMSGHTSDQAGDGEQALERLRATRYDLVILDRTMPRMSGVQVVTTLRSNPDYRGVRVLMCTSASVTREVDEAFEAGADDYILKPINLKGLIEKVDRHLKAGPRKS